MQSGKTLLAKAVFASESYVSPENPEEWEFAERDRCRFLQRLARPLTEFKNPQAIGGGYKSG